MTSMNLLRPHLPPLEKHLAPAHRDLVARLLTLHHRKGLVASTRIKSRLEDPLLHWITAPVLVALMLLDQLRRCRITTTITITTTPITATTQRMPLTMVTTTIITIRRCELQCPLAWTRSLRRWRTCEAR